jgi:glutathione S-transferase
MAAITLYDLDVTGGRRPSPYCWRAKFALAHKRLASEQVPVGFTEKDKIAFAGARTLPVLVDHKHGDKVVKDSWDIAVHLDEAYADGPALLGGERGKSFARFVAAWTNVTLHGALFPLVVADIHAAAHPADQPYFRESREKRLGATLEAAQLSARESRLPALRATLEPLRQQLREQPYISGAAPAYPDYTVMGAFMWVRTVSALPLLADDDPLQAWIGRMLDLFDGMGRAHQTAA